MNEERIARLIDLMDEVGLHFDELESAPDALRFTHMFGGTATYFESWEYVEYWLTHVDWEDPLFEASLIQLSEDFGPLTDSF